MRKTIYMDYQSTTPCDKRVFDVMAPYFCDIYGNPHSVTHVMGKNASDAVENARVQVADLINAEDPKEIIFTSGATESNNMAIQGVCEFYRDRGNKLIVSAIEHKCVIESAYAMQRNGFEVVFVPVLNNGIIDMAALRESIDSNTVLVSVMFVNNEIGVRQPIDEISKICKERKVLFHTDAAQAVGKIDVDVSKCDLMSISGHKLYGPKGIGALYVRMKPRVRLTPLFYGGGQERGMRSGTLPTPLCVGFGEACRIAKIEMHDEYIKLAEFKSYFLNTVMGNLEKVYINGELNACIPGCINLSFAGVEGESIMLGMRDICVSSGSACTSASLESSYVLKAIDVAEDVAHSSIRIGFGRFTEFEEVEYTANKLVSVVKRLREMSPLW